MPPAKRTIIGHPQVFWTNGKPWREVNLWALEMARSRDLKIKTVRSSMEHLHKYAEWLEQEQIDWRHFPKAKAERVLVRYRGYLIEQRDAGALQASTTMARMDAVIRFYRYATGRNFISCDAQKWQEKSAVLP